MRDWPRQVDWPRKLYCSEFLPRMVHILQKKFEKKILQYDRTWEVTCMHCLFICLSVHSLSIHLSLCSSVHLYIHPSVHPSIHLRENDDVVKNLFAEWLKIWVDLVLHYFSNCKMDFFLIWKMAALTIMFHKNYYLWNNINKTI